MTLAETPLDEVIKAVDGIIAEKGENYVYPPAREQAQCYYSNEDGSPGCIVGHVVARLDPDAYQHLLRVETEIVQNIRHGLVRVAAGTVMNLITDGVINVDDEDTEDALAALQALQDKGRTWGEAVAEFNRIIDLSGGAS